MVHKPLSRAYGLFHVAYRSSGILQHANPVSLLEQEQYPVMTDQLVTFDLHAASSIGRPVFLAADPPTLHSCTDSVQEHRFIQHVAED